MATGFQGRQRSIGQIIIRCFTSRGRRALDFQYDITLSRRNLSRRVIRHQLGSLGCLVILQLIPANHIVRYIKSLTQKTCNCSARFYLFNLRASFAPKARPSMGKLRQTDTCNACHVLVLAASINLFLFN